ncbi:hypothetical protein Q2T49_33645, partial [Pseudomonas aeruginosa]|uniref:hypothetical protein n=1 Tax=Pseudomonas aeruginosa TaxID=287 RepID=UPI00265E1B47
NAKGAKTPARKSPSSFEVSRTFFSGSRKINAKLYVKIKNAINYCPKYPRFIERCFLWCWTLHGTISP